MTVDFHFNCWCSMDFNSEPSKTVYSVIGNPPANRIIIIPGMPINTSTFDEIEYEMI